MRKLWLAGAVMALMAALAWWQVYHYHRGRVESVTRAWTGLEMQVVRSAARASQAWLEHNLDRHSGDSASLERDAFERFVAPLRMLASGHAWVYESGKGLVFQSDPESDQSQLGLEAADIFRRQEKQGASHYAEVAEGMKAGGEGTAWFIWRADRGREYVAWTSFRAGGRTWTIGLSTPESEILDHYGLEAAYDRERRGAASITLLLAVVFATFWWQVRQEGRRRAELEDKVAWRTVELLRSNAEQSQLLEQARSAQQALAQSEARARATLSALPDLVFRLDRRGTCLEVHAHDPAALILPAERILGRTIDQLLPRQASGLKQVILGTLESGRAQPYEFSLNPREGAELHYEIRMAPCGPDEVLAIARDVTDKVESRRELAESEQRYRVLVEHATQGIGVIQDLCVVFANQQLLDMTGYTMEEMAGIDARLLAHPDDRPAVEERHRSRMAGDEVPVNYDARLLTKPGQTLWVSASAVVLAWRGRPAVMVLFTDISRRKLEEEELRSSEQRHRSLVENVLVGMFVCELPDGSISYANPKLCEMGGYTLEEFTSLTLWDIVDPSEHDTLRRRTEERTSGMPMSSVIYTGRGKDGRRMRLEVDAVMLEDQGHRILHGVVVDVTEKELLASQLQHAQKMEAVGTLASGIAHDFNNILQATGAYVELVQRSERLSPEASGHLAQVERALGRAADLVRRLLTFSRKMEPQLAPLDLNREVAAAVLILERTIPPMIRLEMDLAARRPQVLGDAGQLSQVVLNLAANARDAMRAGGLLTFRTRDLPEPAVLLEVSDTGVGMDQEIRDKVFEPFFTTKKPGEGTGLGLSSVYGIVQAHGGRVTCASAPGRGTTFSVVLPAWQGAPAAASDQHSPPEQTEATGGAVLVVDDERSILETAAEALVMHGFEVRTAVSGEEALQLLGDGHGPLDLVIMDLGMPGMGGLACLKLMRRARPEVPVLISSGYAGDGVLAEAMEHGAIGILHKPYRLDDLVERVRRVLHGRGLFPEAM